MFNKKTPFMHTEVFLAADRGHADYGWLSTFHHFNFANYFNPLRERFGLLRVFNDDTIAGGTGFEEHPHANMEIISIPLQGALKHRDSMGNSTVIRTGEIQIMSAGTGIRHSEFNFYADEETKFLQIWLFPKLKNIVPRYDQRKFASPLPPGVIQTYISPRKEGETIWINQDAWVSRAFIAAQSEVTYKRNLETNGIFIFVISGEVTVAGQILTGRDAMGISGTAEITVTATMDTDLLIIEVPME
jgi:quercetin 2,3-dioxygenase